MALLTEAQVLRRADQEIARKRTTVSKMLTETVSLEATFDVFLSHSSAEPEKLLLGVKGYLEDEGLAVYVDKYTDPQLALGEITPETAELLRMRMRKSATLLYIHSRHSKISRWMPWELGYSDGVHGRVGILPVAQVSTDAFHGEEYLGLYPYVDQAHVTGTENLVFFINRNQSTYARLRPWLRGKAAIRKRA